MCKRPTAPIQPPPELALSLVKPLGTVFTLFIVVCLCIEAIVFSISTAYSANMGSTKDINQDYRREIAALWKAYQKVHNRVSRKRETTRTAGKRVTTRDSASTVKAQLHKKFKQLIRRYGWPAYDLIGKSYADRAVSLIIYQRNDFEFQKEALHAIRALAERGQASWTKYAYLYDLVMVHEGKKQLYGTQLDGVKIGSSCILAPKPIHDADHVNSRRMKVGFSDSEHQYVKHEMAEACPGVQLDGINIDYVRQLLNLFDEDQAIRTGHHATNYDVVDKKIGKRLKALISEYGWPAYDNVGGAADKAVVLFIHQDDDIEFQKKALAAVYSLAKKKKIGWPGYAYLYDRVAVHEGKKQLYGTQGKCTKDGTWQPFPIDDPYHLDERRKHLNLSQSNGSESEYIASFNQICEKQERERQDD